MTRLVGRVYRPGEGWSAGWIEHDGTTVLETGDTPPARQMPAILPAPVNAHTHVGDIVARGHDITGMTLAQVVAPPHGLKHRLLRADPPTVETMRAAAREVASSGARAFVDFREGGPEGARLLREAAGSCARIFGRCAGAWDEAEARRVLESADGLGLSAMKDHPAGVPEAMAAFAHRQGKRFAMHLSEDAREDVDRALALAPEFVVHCVRAVRTDIRKLADADVPIVLCPRSNARFGPLPDVATMIAECATLALGSDNAMLQSLDVLDDARALVERGVGVEAALDAAIAGGARVADGKAPVSWLRAGDPAAHVLLAATDILARRPKH